LFSRSDPIVYTFILRYTWAIQGVIQGVTHTQVVTQGVTSSPMLPPLT